MKTAISTSLFWKGASAIDDCFKIIDGCGFELIEFDAHNIFSHLSPKFLDKIARGLNETGLFISSVHMPYLYPISSASKSVRNSAIKSYAKTVESFISKVECRCLKPLTLVFHPGINLDRISYIEQKSSVESGLKEIGRLFDADRRFRLAFENMLSSHFASTADDILYISRLAKDSISLETGICFDSCHAAYDNLPHDFLRDIIGEVSCVHLSDNFNQPHGEFHAIPMSVIHSKIDWKKIMELLKDKMSIITLELSKPPAIKPAAYLQMARISASELQNFVL